jgi:hypothetical protein
MLMVGKTEGKRPLGRRRRWWWVNNIKMDLAEIVCGSVDWIDMAWRAFVNVVMNLRIL